MTAPLLVLRDITKSFGGIKALTGVSCEVMPGQIVGVIGPNGAGKTTLFNVITGAYRADRGEVRLGETAITRWSAHRIARAGIVRTFQNIRLFGSMTVFEHLVVAQPSASFLRRFLPLRWGDRKAVARADEVLAFFGLEHVRDQRAKTLSYGMQRKVEIARAVTAAPKLLLLDEPVAGMNHDEATDIRDLMLRLREAGLAILLIEHDMSFVMTLCETLYVLDFGVLISRGGPAEIRTDPAVLDAYLGAVA